MKHFISTYVARANAPTVSVARRQLREAFEFGPSPKEVCADIVDGLSERTPKNDPNVAHAIRRLGALYRDDHAYTQLEVEQKGDPRWRTMVMVPHAELRDILEQLGATKRDPRQPRRRRGAP